MKLEVTALVFLIGVVTVSLGCASAENPRAAYDMNTHGTNAITRYLWPALASMKKSGRVYYAASCQTTGSDFHLFSQLEMHPLVKTGTELAAIRSMFQTHDRVFAVEGPSGIVRITIGDVPTTLLSTKIGTLALKPLEQYNRTLAIAAIERTPEVRAAMGRLGVNPLPRVVNELMVEPQEGLPHLPSTLRDITVDEALDAIVTSFGGIVYYGYCPKARLYDVVFGGGAYFRN